MKKEGNRELQADWKQRWMGGLDEMPQLVQKGCDRGTLLFDDGQESTKEGSRTWLHALNYTVHDSRL